MVGMRDVAKAAGVSLSTVSLVVNKTGYVSEALKQRVQEAMRKLDYVPNELARNFYTGSTHVIGIIVPTTNHPFFSSLIASIQHALSQKGFQTLLCSTIDYANGEAAYVDMLKRHIMDGVIMASHTIHDANYWSSIDRPIVAFDRYLGSSIHTVASNHRQGGRLIASQLIASHARHVVNIGGPRKQFHDLSESDMDFPDNPHSTSFPTVRYHLTLEHDLQQAGIRYTYLESGEVYDWETYRRVASEVFYRFPDVDAIVGSDLTAAYCTQEALRRHINIPGELQIIAYDGSFLTNTAGMRISTVRQDFEQLAERLVEQIITAVAHSESPNTISDTEKMPQQHRPVNSNETIVPVTFLHAKTTRSV